MRYLYLLLGLFCGTTAFAQTENSATFFIADVEADNGDRVCLPVTAINFSNGIEFSFALRWQTPADGGALTFSGIDNINTMDLPFFSLANFNTVDYSAAGLVTVEWGNYPAGSDCSASSGSITLDDNVTLFEICFDVDPAAPLTSNHPVTFFDKPDDNPLDGVDDSVDIAFRKPDQCASGTNTMPGANAGSVTIGVSPLVLSIPDVSGEFQPGDTYCVDINVVSGFNNLTGLQFGVFYDPTILRAISVDPNTDLRGHGVNDYNLYPDVRNGGESIYSNWNDLTSDNSYSLPDGSRYVTLCFEIIGDCGQSTDIRIGGGDNPRGNFQPIDAGGATLALASIPVITTGNSLFIENCNSRGFDVVLDCPDEPVNFGDTEVCVDVRAGDDFVDMVDIRYLISFDPDILEFTGIGTRAPSLFINPNDDFDTDQVGDGVLIFDWDSRDPKTLAEGELVYQACFTAVGFGGTSPLNVSRFRNDPESSSLGFFSGINPDNCAITVQQPEGVALTFPDLGFSSTAETCFPVEVTGFTNVTEMSIFVIVPSAQLEYLRFTPAVTGLVATELSPGLIQLTYNGPAVSIPDGGSLGEFCLRAQDDATPGDCATIGTSETIPARIVTTESEGNAVSVQRFNGEACVLFPNGFGLVVGQAEGFINEQVCVPVSVSRFQDISFFSVEFVFDPTLLTYTSANVAGSPLPNLSAANFNTTNAAAGRVLIEWLNNGPDGIDVSTTDTVQIFELCFDAGADDTCAEIEARDGAEVPTLAGGTDGSILYNNGEICLNDKLELISISAIPATCPDSDDGAIVYQTGVRPGGEDIFIRVDGPRGVVRYGNMGRVEGLLPGTNDYVLYNSGSSVRMEGTIVVGFDTTNAAIAQFDAETAQLSCGDNPIAAVGGRNNQGETWQLFVALPQGGRRLLQDGPVNPNDGTISATVAETGQIILEVTSAAGCTDRDTMTVLPPANPTADAGEDTALTCNGTGVDIGGANSSVDNNAVYRWERVATDGTVLEVVGNQAVINVTEPGRYNLTVTFPVLNCEATDQVIVRDENNIPRVTLPQTAALNCDGGAVTLSIGEPEADVAYNWIVAGSPTVVSTTTDYRTDQTGTYVVTSTNTLTGCSRMDSVTVVPSAGAPVITVPTGNVYFACDPDTLRLPGITYDNVNQDTRYRWTTEDGRVVITDLDIPNPRVVLPGTYKVVVRAGACVDSAEVKVLDPALPRVEAGDEQRLACGNAGVTLTGEAMIVSDEALTFQWTLDGEEIVQGGAATVVVNQPGLYLLTATSPVGCTGVDSVLVRQPDGFPGYALVDTVRGLGCAPDVVRFGLQEAGADDYDVVWTDPSGQEIGTSYFVSTGVEGLHRLTVTNPATGCVRMDSVLVIADAAGLPIVAFRQNSVELNCENTIVWLDGSPSSQGENFTYRWETLVGNEQPESQGNDSLRVRSAGIYRLTVVNTLTNCSNMRDVVVTDPRVFPQVDSLPAMTLNCDVRETIIGINILDQPNDFSIQWSGPATVGMLPRDTTRITVTEGGTYNAVVINSQTSCVTTVAIRVEDLIDSIATIAIMAPDSFDCNNSTITISAADTELNGTNPDNIVWTSFDGNNVTPPTGSLIVNVDGPGDYELAISDASGCTVRDTVRVEAATDTPFAQAGEDIEIECGDMPQLDGSASTPGPLPGILYEWTALGEGTIISGGDSPRPFVSGAGTYQLVISNLSNGCSDTATTVVTLSQAVAADAGTDFNTCDPSATVTGNLPASTRGVWTAFNDEGSVWSATDNVATITEIGDGLSLVWTLSAGMGCENYSADTVRVGPEDTPVANNDVLEVGGSETVGTIDLLQNDERSGPVTVTLLGEPSFGEILSNLNGTITFEAPQGVSEQTIIEYEVCSNTCPNLCSRATLTIFSDANGTDPTVYNAISPNGDGMNDVFYFEKLARNPEEFPDNEMIIFNRWGDIVYKAKPYNNDWDGTSDGGTALPEGTYYYVLRLNVGEGDIIRGDVTVVR